MRDPLWPYDLIVALCAAWGWLVLRDEPDVDHDPLSEEEEAYGRAYAETLAVGEETPDDSHLEPERAAAIRQALEQAWRSKVRPIYRRSR